MNRKLRREWRMKEAKGVQEEDVQKDRCEDEKEASNRVR